MYYEIWGPVLVKVVEVGGKIRWRRKGTEEREGTRRRKKLESEVSDFWERNRPERDRGYRIPEVNRRRVKVGRSEATGKGEKRK